MKFKINCKLFTLTLRLCWMNYLLKRPRPFLYWCGVPYLQFRGFLTLEHGAFFVQTSHTFREKATFEDFTIKPTSEGIKEAKLSSLFVLTLEQLAAATTFGLGTKYHVSFSSHAKKKNWLCVTVIIPDNFFSLWQSKNYHKAFLKVFRKKGTILRTFKTFLTFPLVTRQVERYHLENVAACSV